MPNTFQSQSTQGSSHAGQRRSPVRLMFVLVLVQLFSVILDGLTKPAGQIYPQQDTDAKQAWKGLPQNGGTGAPLHAQKSTSRTFKCFITPNNTWAEERGT